MNLIHHQFFIQSAKLALLFVSPSASDRGWHGRFPSQKALRVIAGFRAVWSSCHSLAVFLSAPVTFLPLCVACAYGCHGCQYGTNRCSQLSFGWHNAVWSHCGCFSLIGRALRYAAVFFFWWSNFFHLLFPEWAKLFVHCSERWGKVDILLKMVIYSQQLASTMCHANQTLRK